MDWRPSIALFAFLDLIGFPVSTPSLPAPDQDVLASNVPINGPTDLAIDNQGHLLVNEMIGYRVRMIDLSTGAIKTVAGDGKNFQYEDGSLATDCVLGSLRSLALDSDGNIFLGERNRVRRVDARTGAISTVAGVFKSGKTVEGVAALDAQFWDIDGLAVDALGDLFIADGLQRKIFRVDADTGIVHTYAGTGRYGLSGNGFAAVNANFEWANSIALDKDGNLFIADLDDCRIRRIDHQSGIIDSIGIRSDVESACDERTSKRGGASSYSHPTIDGEGNVYFVDTAGNRVWRIDANTSTTSVIAGTGRQGYSGDSGPATLALLDNPSGLAVDSEGNLFIAEFANNRIRRVDGKTKVITTFAGNGPLHLLDSPILEVAPTGQPKPDSHVPPIDSLPIGPHD